VYNCILVSLDGSLESEAVLPEVERLLAVHPARVILLSAALEVDLNAAAQATKPDIEFHAHELPREVFEVIRTSTERSALLYLEGIARRLEQTGAQVQVVVSYNRPAEAIRFYARTYDVDLIAMTTHGRSGFSRLRFGSVTEAVLHHAPCPMLVARVPETLLPRFAPEYAEAVG
jgi:nucleotide-binding universal stress UspA family protein